MQLSLAVLVESDSDWIPRKNSETNHSLHLLMEGMDLLQRPIGIRRLLFRIIKIQVLQGLLH